ncbi:MAG: Gx transporter family protein [Clostridia bacterium]|nr:Gx transporter family protein [Clostridia bacterium]
MAKRLTNLALLTACALMLSYIESLIPLPFPIPGIKLGLANLASVFALYRLSYKDALLISAVRVLISGFLFTTPVSMIYALSGALFSLSVMALMKRANRFSVTFISCTGGMAHNLAQVTISYFIVSHLGIFSYLPALLISGLITGLIIGMLSDIAIRRIPK